MLGWRQLTCFFFIGSVFVRFIRKRIEETSQMKAIKEPEIVTKMLDFDQKQFYATNQIYAYNFLLHVSAYKTDVFGASEVCIYTAIFLSVTMPQQNTDAWTKRNQGDKIWEKFCQLQ